jgi:hypothetical protein
MNRLRLRALSAALSVATGVVVAAAARGDDRATAEALLLPLEQDVAHASITADAVKHARVALERARRMRDANDEPHARLAEALGRRWSEVGRDLVRVADAEHAATAVRLAADDAGARAERERSLLEEAIATQGRFQAELDGIQSKQGPDKTAAVGASIDGGVTAPKARKNHPIVGGAAGARVPDPDGAEAGVMP